MSKSDKCKLAIEIEVQHNCHLVRYDTFRYLRERNYITRNTPQPWFTPTKIQLVAKYFQTVYPDWSEEFGGYFEQVTTITHKDLRKWLDMARGQADDDDGDDDNDGAQDEYADSSDDESFEPNLNESPF